MRLLLDTHVFLWSKANDLRMSANAWSMLRDPANELFMSVVSIAEVAIKVSTGKLSLGVPMPEFVEAGMKNGQIAEMPLRMPHAITLSTLPFHHRDPFDRLLIATAIVEDLTILTNDPEMGKYAVNIAW
jgi:PIN domain nuclease of toxin-antitoxin system